MQTKTYDMPLYWVASRDPYVMIYEIIPTWLGSIASYMTEAKKGSCSL